MDFGQQELETDLATNVKRRIILAICVVVLLLAVVWRAIPTSSSLIMTESTHDRVVYLRQDGHYLGSCVSLRFAALDYSCNTMQLSICVLGNAKEAVTELKISIDGKEIESFKVAFESTWHGQYAHILLEDIDTDFKEVKVTYQGKTLVVT